MGIVDAFRRDLLSYESAVADSALSTITVAIPTFNRADLIVDAIESVLMQQVADCELLIVDDGSTDGTQDVVRALAPNARYVWQENQGIVGAKNRCIWEATGDYLTILDSDDVLTTNSLRVRAEILERSPEVGLVYGSAWSTDPEGNLDDLMNPAFADASYLRSGRDELCDLLVSNHIVACTVMARREAFEDAGPFDPRLRIYEDWDMWVRIAKSCSVAYVAEPVAVYRNHAGKVGSVFREASLRDIQCYRELCLGKFLGDKEMSDIVGRVRRKMMARHHYVIAARALEGSSRQEARRHSLRSLRYSLAGLRSRSTLATLSLLVATLRPRRSVNRRTSAKSQHADRDDV